LRIPGTDPLRKRRRAPERPRRGPRATGTSRRSGTGPAFGPLPGVTKAGGASTDDFGDTSLPKGLFTKMKA